MATFELGDDQVFEDHEALLEHREDLDAVVVATDVRSHASIACACMEAGLATFLEKPMTRTIEEAIEVVNTARRTQVPIMIGFNLRYAPFYRRLKQLVSDGAVGQLVSIEWKEILSPQAWADGYCRAGWYSQKEKVGGWLLEKSCHDIDQINWLVDAPCERVASFGSRSYFVPRKDVPLHCSDGCPIEEQCNYAFSKLHPGGPESLPDYVPAERADLCVYHSGSDLTDRQVAALEYANGVTVAFSILSMGYRWERVMRICGSEATIRGSDYEDAIRIYRHDGSEPIIEDPQKVEGGHGGADPGVLDGFLDYVDDSSCMPIATLEDGLESMLAAGGIELACEQKRVIELGPWRQAR